MRRKEGKEYQVQKMHEIEKRFDKFFKELPDNVYTYPEIVIGFQMSILKWLMIKTDSVILKEVIKGLNKNG